MGKLANCLLIPHIRPRGADYHQFCYMCSHSQSGDEITSAHFLSMMAFGSWLPYKAGTDFQFSLRVPLKPPCSRRVAAAAYTVYPARALVPMLASQVLSLLSLTPLPLTTTTTIHRPCHRPRWSLAFFRGRRYANHGRRCRAGHWRRCNRRRRSGRTASRTPAAILQKEVVYYFPTNYYTARHRASVHPALPPR